MRIIVLGIFLSFIIVGCTMPWNKTPEKITYETTLSEASEKIKNTAEFDECMRPQAEMCISQVGNTLAQAKNDINFCGELPTGEKENCEYIITLLSAKKSTDISICNVLSGDQKENCRSMVVNTEMMEKKDINICDKMIEGVVSGELPGKIQIEKRDRCIADYINQYGKVTDGDLCNKLSDKTQISQCIHDLSTKK